jgi:coproporphyrinogen III oxidase-like Fe-S oxidoreductase
MGNECYYCDFNMTTLTDKEIFEYKQWILKQTKPDRIRLRDMFHYIRDDING